MILYFKSVFIAVIARLGWLNKISGVKGQVYLQQWMKSCLPLVPYLAPYWSVITFLHLPNGYDLNKEPPAIYSSAALVTWFNQVVSDSYPAFFLPIVTTSNKNF